MNQVLSVVTKRVAVRATAADAAMANGRRNATVARIARFRTGPMKSQHTADASVITALFQGASNHGTPSRSNAMTATRYTSSGYTMGSEGISVIPSREDGEESPESGDSSLRSE